MPSTTLKRRRTEEGMRGKAPKKRVKVKKQKHYHSSDDDSEDENFATDAPKEAPKKDFVPVDIGSSADEEEAPAKPVSILRTKTVTKNVPEEAPADEEAVEPVSEDDNDEDQAQAGAEESDLDASDLSDEGSDLSET
jgi:fusion and transport protein UGO1